MKAQNESYLRCTAIIDCDTNSIRKKALDLTEGQQKITEKAKRLFYFVRDRIKYNPYLFTLNANNLRASATLARREGYCVQKAVLLTALARAVSIPARLRFADIRNHIIPKKLEEVMGTNVFIWHGYSELYIEGRWLKVTPSFDIKMCRENRIVPVDFDGKGDAVFHAENQDGKLHIEYVKDYGHYPDVPMDKIIETYDLRRMEHTERLRIANDKTKDP